MLDSTLDNWQAQAECAPVAFVEGFAMLAQHRTKNTLKHCEGERA